MRKIAYILLMFFVAATALLLLSMTKVAIAPEVRYTSEPYYTPALGQYGNNSSATIIIPVKVSE